MEETLTPIAESINNMQRLIELEISELGQRLDISPIITALMSNELRTSTMSLGSKNGPFILAAEKIEAELLEAATRANCLPRVVDIFNWAMEIASTTSNPGDLKTTIFNTYNQTPK